MSSSSMTTALFCAAMGACAMVQLRRRLGRQRSEAAATLPTREVTGRCHCGAVSFRCRVPDVLTVWVCDCSVCDMRKNHHFIIPESDFFESGGDSLTLYTFNTHTAKHTFCKHCGITPFYRPRSNPDGVAVTLACLVPRAAPGSFELRHFDGQNWEGFLSSSGIAKFSQTPSSPASSKSTPAPSPASSPSVRRQDSPATP